MRMYVFIFFVDMTFAWKAFISISDKQLFFFPSPIA